MKSGILAIDPLMTERSDAAKGLRVIRRFQKAGLLLRLRPVAVVHAGLYIVPKSYFDRHMNRFVRSASAALTRFCRGLMKTLPPRVIALPVTLVEQSVRRLCAFTKQQGADLLVLRSSDRRGAAYWLLGSFAETTALTGTVPTMIVKPSSDSLGYSSRPSIIVPFDIVSPPTKRFFDWIGAAAKTAHAVVKLVYVVPKDGEVPHDAAKNGEERRRLEAAAKRFSNRGIDAAAIIVKEGESIAGTIIRFANIERGWMIAMFSAPRSRLRRLLLGSISRQVLRLSKRPFVVVR